MAGFRILIVDDLQDAAVMTQMLLEARGHDCRVATSGHEALVIAAEFDPEVGILDIGLPDLSGFEVARTLRERGHRRMYLAAVTGWGDRETKEKAFRAGFNEHLLKPTSGAMLQHILTEATKALAE